MPTIAAVIVVAIAVPFLLFLLGLIIGSFANVCIVRIPDEESVVEPRSHCRSCREALAWYDNIPLLSFLVLRGRCRNCEAPISRRYPLVELITGVLFAIISVNAQPPLTTVLYLALTTALVIITFIDLDHLIIPDLITLPSILVAPALAYVVGHISVTESLLGIVGGGGVLWAFAWSYELIRKQEGMGFGDVKLIAMTGGLLGLPAAFFTIMFGALSGSIVGGALMLSRRGRLDSEIPFGPFLAAGIYVYMIAGPAIIDWYFGRSGLFS